jgi:hypothetical protein
LPLNHLPAENRETASRIGEVGLTLLMAEHIAAAAALPVAATHE